MDGADFLIIGGGIAGLSAAARLAAHGKVIVLEAEEALGYHSSGRSVSTSHYGIGNAVVKALTLHSRPFFEAQPEGFSDSPIAHLFASLYLAEEENLPLLDELAAAMGEVTDAVERLDADGIARLCPVVRTGPGAAISALNDPTGLKLDADALLQGFARQFRAQGGDIKLGRRVTAIEHKAGQWIVDGALSAPVLVNAAGAWCDAMAGLAGVTPLGLEPKRRTVIAVDPGTDMTGWPFVHSITKDFYMLAEAGQLLVSPVDEVPDDPCDAQPDDYDIALAADRLEHYTTLQVTRIAHRWAGLRTFTSDRTPTAGFAPDAPGFFWLAGQGGYGLQTAPAMAAAVESLIAGTAWPLDDVTPARIAPDRLLARRKHADSAAMSATAIGNPEGPDEPAPPPVAVREWRIRMIKRGIKLFFLVLLIIVAILMLTAPLSRSLSPRLEAPSLTILSAEGEPIARRGAMIGEPIDVTQLPPHVGLAFVAIEDRRFYYHSGIDPWGIGRAIFRNSSSSGLQGGSTITQQLAKTSFLSPARTWTRKAQEAFIALWLEARLTKNEILSRYLSNVYFGDNVYGLRAAARHYFNVDPEDLSVSQAAMLAGVVNLPSRLAPTTNLAAAQRRSLLVLNAMVDSGFITETQAAAARRRPARVNLGPADDTPTGTYFADWVMREASSSADDDYGNRRIRTTLEGDLQRSAVRAVRRAGLGRTQAALVAMRLDGRVVAMVGGRDYAQSPFNRATQAQRQPGSAFKPFVYLAAFRAGFRPDTMVNDAPLRVGDWSPRNYDGHYRGMIPLREAVAVSSNSVAVQTSERVGRANVIAAARDMGISSPLRPDASLPLGVNTVSLLELTAAYTGIASGRFPIRPYGLPEDAPTESSFRRDPEHMAMLREVLHGVVTHGTGRAANLSVPTFGKTGTTSDYRDAWFVGFAGDLVVGVWVGNDDSTPLPGTSGGGVPARIWRAFMTEALGIQAAPAAPPVPLAEADRSDANEAEPTNALAPEPQAPQPQIPEPLIPEGNAVTLPTPPRVEALPKQ